MFLGDLCVDAIPAHELLHVLGRYHEQARPDRDQYVVIHSQNFDSSKSHVATNPDGQAAKQYLHVILHDKLAYIWHKLRKPWASILSQALCRSQALVVLPCLLPGIYTGATCTFSWPAIQLITTAYCL